MAYNDQEDSFEFVGKVRRKLAKKNKSTSGQLKDPGFFRELWQQVRLVFYLMRDREVPLYLKILPFFGILYALFPIDLIADVIPVLGQLDDLTILIIGAKIFIEMAPSDVVARYMDQMRSGQDNIKIVEGEAVDKEPDIVYLEGELADDDQA
jgi:uncharacterized membrane protein YkvA (DUF1232 family)